MLTYVGNYVSNAIDRVYEEAKSNNTDNNFNKTTNEFSKSISLISTQLKPQFNVLSDAYQKIFTPDGFSRKNIENQIPY